MQQNDNTVVASNGRYPPATRPTVYFIGVTTGKSSIMKVFPQWAKVLSLRDTVIRGIDFPPHAEPAAYRLAVEHIRRDPLSQGAVVTTHKIDLLTACRDLFGELDPYAQLMGEICCISKRDGRLIGHAKDPITSGLALEAFLPAGYWQRSSAQVLVLGGGGSSIAITSYLVKPEHGLNRPSRITVTDRSQPRLTEIRRVHEQLAGSVPCEYHHCLQPQDNDRLVDRLPPGSLVINATGLGKDSPGSPITGAAGFPQAGIAWDVNYRGNLVFLDQARAQQQARNLRIEDGWIYFVHGWTHGIAEVFHVDIPHRGPQFDELCRVAATAR